MKMGYCINCGKWATVHGNDERGLVLCDDCCVCYNHCPPLGEHHLPGKYYHYPMWFKWVEESMNNLMVLGVEQ